MSGSAKHRIDGEAIRPSDRRSDVEVRLSDERTYRAPLGTPFGDVLRFAYPEEGNPPIAVIVDGEIRSLAGAVDHDVAVEPVFVSDSAGIRIYSRSLSFLLVVAVSELHPGIGVHIDYSVPYGGYVCHVVGRSPLTEEEVGAVEERMRQLIHEDRPIVRRACTLEELRAFYAGLGEEWKTRRLEGRNVQDLHLHTLNGVSGYFYGEMAPSTGILKTFALEPFSDGLVLRFPRRDLPSKLVPTQDFSALQEVFEEYGEWLKLLGMRDVASLNEAIRSGRIEQVVLVAEALHEKRIAEIAELVKGRGDGGVRVIFIAGPSGSGKTTFSKRLSIQLMADGLQPYPLGMDEYYIPHAQLASRFGDEVDLESLDVLDIDQFRRDVERLLHGERVRLPRFDFASGDRVPGETVRLGPKHILLVEGIHGLNPRIRPEDLSDTSLRIFVSALTQLNLDAHNRVSTTDTRLLRRIVRDAVFRGYSASETLELWENVRRGEKENIFPYQEEADVMFNSALCYELSVLKSHVEPYLLQVRDRRLRLEAERLIRLLRWFDPYGPESIPSNSIVREFVGGSSLRGFSPAPLAPTEETDDPKAPDTEGGVA